MLEGIASAVKDVVSGIADSLQMSGLMALSGRGLVDIPKYWESSSCSLPRMDYTIELKDLLMEIKCLCSKTFMFHWLCC